MGQSTTKEAAIIYGIRYIRIYDNQLQLIMFDATGLTDFNHKNISTRKQYLFGFEHTKLISKLSWMQFFGEVIRFWSEYETMYHSLCSKRQARY